MEGAWNEDGKGLSIWDTFSHTPGKIANRDTGDVACDHYRRYRQDVALMKLIGLRAYRFSISWPRVVPAGVGAVNAKGLDFYDRLIDELLAADIVPYVTLFHWDYPYELYCRGGWLNPDSPEWFADYASLVVGKLSDRVKHWITLNEPQCYIGLGHHQGTHAPGLGLRFDEVLRAAHHTMLAHGKAVQAIRAAAQGKTWVGFAPVGSVCLPASASPADIEAARQGTFAVTRQDFWNNSWFSDPVFLKQYPADGVALYGADMPDVGPNDMDIISQPLDFCGANIYGGRLVRAGADGRPEELPLPTGPPSTPYHFPVTPEALYWGPKFMWERYRSPILITENGMSNTDWVSLQGLVQDPQRADFIARYLLALQRACADGVDVRGYFYWSILDNFEWQEGYRQRFGLIYVDYQTQTRTLKDSARWYREVIRSNGAALGPR